MTSKDLSTLQRFIGVVEGIAAALPKETASLVYDYIEVIDPILEKENDNAAD